MNTRVVTTHCFIHHSASSRDTSVEDIDQWHIARGWDGIGYNLIIMPNGDIEGGRPLEAQGAHTRGHNQLSVGICIIGFGPNFTYAQWDALDDAIAFLERRYPGIIFLGHRDVGSTECPGFDVRKYLLTRSDL